MKLPPRLALVPMTARADTSNVIHISGIRSHGPAAGTALSKPSPRQAEWRNLMRRITKNRDRGGPDDAGEH